MKKYLIMILLAALVFASSTGMDTIPPRVEAKAKLKTDSQLTAMSERQGPDKLIIHFDKLRRHIDSINALNMIARDSFIQASTERDSVMIALMSTLSENVRLKAENGEYRKDLDYALRLPNMLYFLVFIVAGVLIANGMTRGFDKLKEDKRSNL